MKAKTTITTCKAIEKHRTWKKTMSFRKARLENDFGTRNLNL